MTDVVVTEQVAPVVETTPASALTEGVQVTPQLNPDGTAVTPTTAPADGASENTDPKKDEVKLGAPEKYEDFKLPEGIQVDEAAMTEFLPIAKELNLTQDQAQKLIDLQTKYAVQSGEAQVKAWDDTMEAWKTQAKESKEFGGANYDANLALARKAIGALGTPEAVEAFNITGAGNHPAIIGMFVKVGKLMSEGNMFPTGQAKEAAQTKSIADRLFPNQNKS